MADLVPEGITKVNRSQFLTYLDTTPTASNPTWAILGVGITDYAISYNPQTDTEQWIIEDNARTTHESNEKQSSVTQSMYKGDPCFEFAAEGRDKLNYKTHILDIDIWNGTGTTYPATKSDGMLVVTSYGGDSAELEYDLYYQGDPISGTVTINSSGEPTFTPASV